MLNPVKHVVKCHWQLIVQHQNSVLSSHHFVGNDGTYTSSFTNLQRKESHEDISGDLDGQCLASTRVVHCNRPTC